MGKRAMDPNETIKLIRQRILNQQVVVIVGAGVSMQATAGASAASWKGLIRSGIDWCRAKKPSCDADWRDRKLKQLESPRRIEFMGLANEIAEEIGGDGGSTGELAEWLGGTVGALKAERPEILEALHALGCLLVTTNYDGLLDKDGLPPVTWRARTRVHAVIRGDAPGIIHLHGRWTEPESVVLGLGNYAKVRDDEHPKAVLRSLAMTKTLLFVGCGEGLSDPNFATFREWLREVNRDNSSPHYRLCTEAERGALGRDHAPGERVECVVYGKEHKDLPGFLRRLAPDNTPIVAVSAGQGHNQDEVRPAVPGAVVSAGPVHTPALQSYLRRLGEQVRWLSLVGFGYQQQVRLPIERAYVPLQLMATGSFKFDELGRPGMTDGDDGGHGGRDIEVGDIFAMAGRNALRGVLILGIPGAGKTTAVRQLCSSILNDPDPTGGLALPMGVVPVLLRLRDMARDQIDAPWKFVDAALRPQVEDPDGDVATTGRGSVPAGDDPGPDLRKRKGVLWIFDGLDEVVDEATRVRAAKWIAKVLQERPEDRFLVTCRYAGYQGDVNLGPDFAVFHVQALKPPQIEAFVRRWHDVVIPRLHPGADINHEQLAASQSQSLLAILAGEPYRVGLLRQLPSNPLLLTILCLVHNDDGHKLPERRDALYKSCVRVLVNEWRRELFERQGITREGAERAIKVLGSVAWWLHSTDQRTSETIARLGEAALPMLAGLSEAFGLPRNGEDFIRQMRDLSGILAPDGPGRCGFLHLTFQEYLASTHAADEGKAEDLAHQLGSPWWREVILLALADSSMEFANRFFTALASQPAVVMEHEDFVRKVLDEAAHPIVEPLVRLLKEPRKDRRETLALLRILRGRPSADLMEACRRLATADDIPVAQLAMELLALGGQSVPATPLQEGVHMPVGGLRRLWSWLTHPRSKNQPSAPIEVRRVSTEIEPMTGMAFVDVPAGEFQMGSDAGESNERPVHPVRVSAFRMGRYPVTNAEYAKFLAAHPGAPKPRYWDDSQFNDPRQPVVGIDWDQASEFCRWLGGRLPTEAEWEYACRAGTTTEYAFGPELSHEQANFGMKVGRTTPVDQYPANAWGLHDMHGNVCEWCADWYGKKYYESSPALDPRGPARGVGRVLRGGSWNILAVHCRSACRIGRRPGDRIPFRGFRVVLASRSAS